MDQVNNKGATASERETVSMEPLRNIIAEELSKITAELKEFRQDVNKDIS